MNRQRQTTFQKKLIKDKETLLEIVRLFHPMVINTWYSVSGKTKYNLWDDMLVSTKYNWVTVEIKNRAYGRISLGINNMDCNTLWGPKVTKEMMKQAIKSENCTFRVWKFGDDCKYVDIEDRDEREKEEKFFYQQYKDILINAGYEVGPVDEWYKDYYSD